MLALPHFADRWRWHLWPALLLAAVAFKAFLSVAYRPSFATITYGTLVYFLLLGLCTIFAFQNALEDCNGSRAFWILIAGGFALWTFQQWLQVFYRVWFRSDVPDNSAADPALFLHIVPLMAAVAMQPHLQRAGQKLSRASLDFLLLLFFWIFLYAFAIFPYQFLSMNDAVYGPRFTAFYAIENGALVLVLGILSLRVPAPWVIIYTHFFGASALYWVTSTLGNMAIDAGRPYVGTIYSLGQTASVYWFSWVPLRARRLPPAALEEIEPAERTGFVSLIAKIALLTIPLIGLGELLVSRDSPGIRTYRLAVVLAAGLFLSIAVFLKEDLVKRDILRHSRASTSREQLSQVALARSEDSYRDLVEHSHDLLCTHDLAGRLLSCNPAPARILGYEVRELLKTPMRDLVAPGFRHEFDRYLERIRANGADQGLLIVLTRSGERRIWEYHNTLRTEGVPSPIVRGMAHDITERKRAERELRATEERFRQLAENIREVFYLEDAQTLQLLYVSPAYEQVWGRSCQSAFEDLGSFMEGIHPEDREMVRQAFLARRPLSHEYRVIRPDGTLRWIWDRGFPIYDEHGQIYRLAGIAEDITERKRAEQAVQEAHAELARMARLATMGELTASIAHQISQPLTAILAGAGASQRWLAMHPPNLDEAREAASGVVLEASRASEVIKRICALLAKAPPQFRPLDVNDVIREVLSLLSHEFERCDISVQTDLATNLSPVLADRVQLQQALVNLVMNAIDASVSIAARPREVIIRSALDAGGVRVEVHDSGTGLVPQHAHQIFQPFFTTKPQGIGMGLSIARSIVESHGGTISATGRLPYGATFQFTLPKDRAS